MPRGKSNIDEDALMRLSENIALLESKEDIKAFLIELLTPSELHDVTLRWQLLEMLSQGITQRKIAEELKISLCKITRGSPFLKSGNSVLSKLLQQKNLNCKE